MAHDHSDDDGLLWSVLWRLEQVAAVLHEQVHDLVDEGDHEPYPAAVARQRSGTPTSYAERYGGDEPPDLHTDYYRERYGDDEEKAEWVSSVLDKRVKDEPRPPDPPPVTPADLGASSASDLRSPGSFRGRVNAEKPEVEPLGSVTKSFHNVVYGIEEPAARESLRSLLERRAFDDLWVQGGDDGGDRFIEFFAAEGFGHT